MIFSSLTQNKKETNKYLIFNTDLEYVPVILTPKMLSENYNSYIPSDKLTSYINKFDFILKVKQEKINNFTKWRLKQFTQLGYLINNHINKKGLADALEYFKTDLVNDIITQSLELNNSVNIEKVGAHRFSGIVEKFENKSFNHRIYSSTYGPENTNILVANNFIADNYNGYDCTLAYVLMVKKEYIPILFFNNLLGKAIDLSQFQWWINSENATRLTTHQKKSYSKFTKYVKNTNIEIIGKSNINDLLLKFDKPKFNTIAQMQVFNSDLTNYVNKTLYNLNTETVELNLSIKKPNITTVPLKGIRLPKPKKIIPQLID